MKRQNNMSAVGALFCALRLAPAIATKFDEWRAADIAGSPAYLRDSREDGGW